MTFTEALYGSQYDEISRRGGDGNKGRFNGNLLLSAMIMLAFFIVVLVLTRFVPELDRALTRAIRAVFGRSTGKTIGKLLAIPLIAVIYLIVSNTVGSKKNFHIKVNSFLQLPDDVRKKANSKVLIPFIVLLITMMVLALSGL